MLLLGDEPREGYPDPQDGSLGDLTPHLLELLYEVQAIARLKALGPAMPLPFGGIAVEELHREPEILGVQALAA